MRNDLFYSHVVSINETFEWFHQFVPCCQIMLDSSWLLFAILRWLNGFVAVYKCLCYSYISEPNCCKLGWYLNEYLDIHSGNPESIFPMHAFNFLVLSAVFRALFLRMIAYLMLVVSEAVSIGLEAQSHGKVFGLCTALWTQAPAAGVLESSPLSGLELLSFQPHILSLSIPAACLHADSCSSPKNQTAFSYKDELSWAPPISPTRVAYLHNELKVNTQILHNTPFLYNSFV